MINSKNILSYKNTSGIHEINYFIDSNAALSGYIYMGEYSIVEAGAQICNTLLGRFVHIGQNVKIGKGDIHESLALTHPIAYRRITKFFENESILKSVKSKYYYENNPITSIGSDTRICDGAYIISGVHIGRGCIIYPNSVVTSDIPNYCIVAGNPAKIIKYRFDKIEQNILDSNKIEEQSFDSIFWNDPVFNFADIHRIPLYKTELRKIRKKKFFINKVEKNFYSNLLVVGPSHVARWITKVNENELNIPNFEMWGIGGLSIFSKSIDNWCRFWFELNNKNKILLFVPDFRIGNSILFDKAKNPIFIYKNLMKLPNADEELKYKTYARLDYLSHEYKERIKFIFWCQYGRQKLNILAGRHLNPVSGNYEHIFNYEELTDRYKENTLDIPNDDKYLTYIEHDNTIHPTNSGYSFLERMIKSEYAI